MVYQQNLFNVTVAQLLQERGVVRLPKSVMPIKPLTQTPDVLVNYNGLRTAIDGDAAPDRGRLRVAERALSSARQRVEKGIAHIGVAVVYPEMLRHHPAPTLRQALQQSDLSIATVTEAEVTRFAQGNVDYLADLLHYTFEQLTREDVVAAAVALLDSAIEEFTAAISSKEAIVARLSFKLGIPEQMAHLPTPRQMAKLSYEQRGAICRISGLVLINAMISQALLAKHDDRVTALPLMLRTDSLKMAFIDHWDFIVDNINYYSLFHLATELMDSLMPTPAINNALQILLRVAQRIVSEQGLALRHDLMGRVYHRLLGEAKYLGIFYTTIPAAALLLKLSLNSSQPWHDLDHLRQLKIADLSCGTGTLLMAAADALTDNYVSAVTSRGESPDGHQLHQALLENMLYGYDVLPSAVHLTASTLALRMPSITFKKMNLFSLPLGGRGHRLGSVEFLQGNQIEVPFDLFAPQLKICQVSNLSSDEVMVAELPSLDLCVINPPFTRSVGGNLLFGSLPERERGPMQRKLRKLVRQPQVQANTTAGLGSVFVAAADRHLKVGGRLALVLPKALISGVAWEATRQLLRSRYRLDYLITSQDPKRWNFSESTELSEILLVATKIAADESPSPAVVEKPVSTAEARLPAKGLLTRITRPTEATQNDRVIAVNLWRNPKSSFEALAIAFALTHNEALPDVTEAAGALSVSVGQTKIAEAISLPWADLKSRRDWMLPGAFAQADLIRVAYHLERGQLWLPGQGPVAQLSLRPLGEFGRLGPDRRDIHDGFSRTDVPSSYAAFWGQSAAVNCLNQTPNRYLEPLVAPKKGRHWRDPEKLWLKAGRLLLLERLRLNTQSVVAVRLPRPVLSNMWWEFVYQGQLLAEEVEKTLALWLNSTLGLFSLLIHRQETQGAWVAFKKPVLHALPVLDLSRLSAEQLTDLAFIYDEIADEPLFPFPEMHLDPIRAEIDRRLADSLHLPDFSSLRDLLAQEPVVCMQRL